MGKPPAGTGTPSAIAKRPDPAVPAPSATIGPDAWISAAAVWSLARNPRGTGAVCPAGTVTWTVSPMLPPPSCSSVTVASTLVAPSFTNTIEGTGSSPNAVGSTTQSDALVLVPLVAVIVALALYPQIAMKRGERAVERSLAKVQLVVSGEVTASTEAPR